MQKSVFAAPFLDKKHLVRLQSALRHCYARQPLSPRDSLLIIPLREEYAADIAAFGSDALTDVLGGWPRKIIL